MLNRNEEIKRLYGQGFSMEKLANFFDISHERARQIIRGKIVHITRKRTKLSPKETQVIELIAQGLCDNEIAIKLSNSPRTIQTYVARIINKLHAQNRPNAVYLYYKKGNNHD